ncbi:meprin A subunit beta-like [Pagrus major]|uniref:meprin A subunit beta-like n=1 Tax=Pagrus major TaxID=143350 RepID=UPI003CC84917
MYRCIIVLSILHLAMSLEPLMIDVDDDDDPDIDEINEGMNAKGLILQAFEHFRLKTCIDFRPRQSDEYYVSIRKNPGCYSYVSRLVKNGQTVSIGNRCDRLAIIEHEIMHCLGLHHEQSRYDRDDHITIMWDNIKAGHKGNFHKLSPSKTTTFNTPYDYLSVMHYGKKFFSKNSRNTIVTKLPQYQDKIGQRLEMSPIDVYKLNRLYNCSYFMHASTKLGQEGDSAWLETKRMSPTRKCHVQCLQFYFYHSGSESDQLNIWIREFRDKRDSQGNLRLMDQITGELTNAWQFYKVPLNAAKPFQVVFEVRKGNKESSGGFSIDDINLSESECPHNVWKINNFERLLTNTDFNSYLKSPVTYSADGYAYQVVVALRETYFGVYFRLVSGDNDSTLEWPFTWRQVNIIMLDQNPHIQQQMSKQMTITTDPSYGESI